MKTKDSNVNIWGLEREMQPVLKAAERIWKEYGQELVITSARDAIHSAGSLHYYGLAVDMRTRYFTDTQKTLIASALQVNLGQDYDVITHKSHIHCEYDPA